MKLTQKTIAALKLKDKSEAIYFDDDLPGFGLRLRANGQHRWIYQFKIGPKHRRMTLGRFPALPLATARDTARDLHAKVRLGRDPAGEKANSKARVAETVAAVLQSYLGWQRARLRPRSYVEVERHLLTYAKPLHGLQLAGIDRRTVATRLSAIANTNGAVTANRVRASLSAFFAWAVREGIVENNPVLGTNVQDEKSRDRVLKDHELKSIWEATDNDSDYGAIVRLLMLTGQRRDEIGGLRWSEIADDQIVLSADRTKNKRGHSVPLSSPALAILNGRRRGSGDFVFGRVGHGFKGWGTSKTKLDQRIAASGAEVEAWSHHDMRRTLSTRMHGELGIAPHVVEAVLNHVSGHRAGVAGVYNRASYQREKAAALARWADYVLAIVEDRTSNVLTFPAS